MGEGGNHRGGRGVSNRYRKYRESKREKERFLNAACLSDYHLTDRLLTTADEPI